MNAELAELYAEDPDPLTARPMRQVPPTYFVHSALSKDVPTRLSSSTLTYI